jgi:hypothetical protein
LKVGASSTKIGSNRQSIGTCTYNCDIGVHIKSTYVNQMKSRSFAKASTIELNTQTGSKVNGS